MIPQYQEPDPKRYETCLEEVRTGLRLFLADLEAVTLSVPEGLRFTSLWGHRVLQESFDRVRIATDELNRHMRQRFAKFGFTPTGLHSWSFDYHTLGPQEVRMVSATLQLASILNELWAPRKGELFGLWRGGRQEAPCDFKFDDVLPGGLPEALRKAELALKQPLAPVPDKVEPTSAIAPPRRPFSDAAKPDDGLRGTPDVPVESKSTSTDDLPTVVPIAATSAAHSEIDPRSKLSETQRVILAALSKAAGQGKGLTIKDLVRECDRSETAVIRALNKLKSVGFVITNPRNGAGYVLDRGNRPAER